jgi:glucuronoarabinoxylan endo-1,4-beta-xylanase
MKPVSHPVLALLAWLAAGCDAGSEEFKDPTGRPVAVDWAAVRQSITGFGASSAWTAPRLSDSLAEQFFSVDNGIGLSIVRLRIAPDGTTAETETAKLANSYGAKVWAAPWSPPAEWKLPPSDGSMTEEAWRLPQNGGGLWGGRLDPQHYGAWAERLVTFAQTLEAEGVPLYALSAQNEPDYQARWETCLWTPTELQTFVRDHLAPQMEEAGLDAHLIAPEASGWGSFARYADALIGDAATRDVVSVFATHGYNGTAYEYSPTRDHGKELWMTEVSDSDGSDRGAFTATSPWVR